MTTCLPTPLPGSDVTSTAALRSAGVSAHTIASRCRPSGPWQRLFPGVVLLNTTPPTRRDLLHAALTYAGPEAVITGTDAMRAHAVPAPPSDEILVLIPATRRVASRPPLVVERTTRLPVPQRRAGLPVAPLARATIDAARREPNADRLKSVLFAPVAQAACSLTDLRTELDAGNQRGSAAVRALLTKPNQEDLIPLTQALTTSVLQTTPLPPPRWQVALHTPHGHPLGTADAWWPTAGLAWNVETATPPLPTTTEAAPSLTEAGITVLHTAPTRLRSDPRAVATELVEAYAYASRNPHLPRP
ncbi:hypothetical protein [Actinophytocola xanthii]|uniref:Uncharacterized protein n=1 Tax=Actinophytocola xanthii TaxID=1912961 RepID=A0A1Q8CKG4_9PSEU|nr:hypothetical protein [Actinophytocola xanthii]OLF14855.1 hypothetical protein BU204_25230 [Actinophytocola xanthii]